MIQIANGADVQALLRKVIAEPHTFAEVVICSPFIDDPFISELVELMRGAARAACAVRVVTAGTAATRLLQALPQPSLRWKGAVVTHPHLHAKIYIAIARERAGSEAIVTSANLTRCGVHENVELGLRAVANTDEGRAILQQVRRFVMRLAA